MASPAGGEGPAEAAPVLPAEDVAALTDAVTGVVLRPGDADYAAECATFNLAVKHRPAIVVGAADAADVQAAVRFATAHALPVTVLATGHQAIVPADGAMMITTRRMTGVTVDPERRRAVVQAGVLAQQAVDGAAAYGLAPTVGSSPNVGVVGFTLGGGLSPTFGRSFGWAADYVHVIEVVTADGELRRVSATDEPDLFWALRGSRSNMGVVTAVELELHDVTRLYGGGLFFAGRDAAAVLHAYRRFAAGAPDALTSSAALLRLPDAPGVADVLRGAFVVHVRVAYVGDAEAGERLVAPLRESAPLLRDTLGEMSIVDFASIHHDAEEPLYFREWTAMLGGCGSDTVEAMLELAGPQTDPPAECVELRHMGGALGRQIGPPSAVGNRDAEFVVWIMSMRTPSEGDPERGFAERVLARMRPWSTGRIYLNFTSLDTTPVREAYTPEAYARLRELKAVYDPGDVFRLNQNVPPADGT